MWLKCLYVVSKTGALRKTVLLSFSSVPSVSDHFRLEVRIRNQLPNWGDLVFVNANYLPRRFDN